ncbi:MAG: S8 family serine peptidase [Xanthomonadaceae bacterium]|nr:S8 family serine peptidase [Xanthomonadaceae bacterium]
MMSRRRRMFAFAVALGLGAATGVQAAPPPTDWSAGYDAARLIVVAVANKPDPQPAAGATPRGYDALPNYAGGDRAIETAARLSADYGLSERAAWVIEPLRLRCLVFALPERADRTQLLAELQRDKRVRLAQPLQEFETLAGAAAPPVAAAAAPDYNDPYLSLQRSFSTIAAGAAQRATRGDGVRIALIDTGVDAAHPDLAGRIRDQRDFVGGAADTAERHGTEVAGVISAVANNKLGIVGVAPGAQLLAYRACWPATPQAASARCNTFTLALALGAALDSDARIINLSLGGPADPLLQELVAQAQARGIVVVGAVPPDRRMDGFPVGIPGVIAVAAAEDSDVATPALRAPGRDVLTLEPGGHFDYASGSSLATAHVTGALALLLALDRHGSAADLAALLQRSQQEAGRSIDVCRAIAALRRDPATCAAPAVGSGG